MTHSLKIFHLWLLFTYLFYVNGGNRLQCGGPNNVGDLEKQPFYRFLRSTYILHPIALGGLLYALGGFPFIVWGMVRKHFPLSCSVLIELF